jgi:hypothetical protein
MDRHKEENLLDNSVVAVIIVSDSTILEGIT